MKNSKTNTEYELLQEVIEEEIVEIENTKSMKELTLLMHSHNMIDDGVYKNMKKSIDNDIMKDNDENALNFWKIHAIGFCVRVWFGDKEKFLKTIANGLKEMGNKERYKI